MKNENENSEKPQEYPNNVRRVMNEVRIADLAKRIDWFLSRNDELLELSKEMKQNLLFKDITTADEIVELNRELVIEQNKIYNSQNAIDMINSRRLNDKKAYDDNMNSMKKHYEDTKLQFISQLKMLYARINNLENFKNKVFTLKQKLEANDNLMRDKDENLKRKLHQIHLKFKIDREKLIEDLRYRIFELSKSWESDNKEKKSLYIRKLFNENVCLKFEIDEFKRTTYDEQYHIPIIKNIEFRIKRSEQETFKSLTAIEVQKKLIDELKKRFAKAEQRHGPYTQLSEEILKEYDSSIDKLKTKIMYREREISEWKLKLNKENIKVQTVSTTQENNKFKIKKRIEQLYDIKNAVACALQVVDTAPEILTMTKTQFRAYLRNFVNK